MWRTTEGSTGRLVQLCLGYFFFYVITGITVKYFLGSAQHGLPGMHGIEFLVYSTAGGEPRTRTAAFAADSLGIAHAAVVGDRILYGFNRGGYRLHTVALSTLAT